MAVMRLFVPDIPKYLPLLPLFQVFWKFRRWMWSYHHFVEKLQYQMFHRPLDE